MATLAELKTRIADELDRNDLTTQIGYAVSDAIALYSAKRFRFNQAISAFDTVADNEFYSTVFIPTDIGEVDSLTLEVNGRKVVLDPWSYKRMEGIASTTNTTSQPFAWAWYADKIRLYPVPDATYAITISYLKKIAAPGETSSNVWTADAGALIRHAAKRIIASDVLRDDAAAMAWVQSEQLEYRRLRAESVQLETGSLRGSM